MPAIGPVYQPTTYNVGYEQQTEWPHQPRKGRLMRLSEFLFSRECCVHMFIALNIIAVIFTIFIIMHLYFGDNATDQSSFGWYIMLTIMAVGCIILSAIWWLVYWIRNRFSWPIFIRKDGLVRQMSNQNRNGQTIALNPSTDLLVTSVQYGPVIEAPPAMHEEDETRTLMANHNKELNEEAEERPIETDPRIVLRPPGQEEV